MPFTKVFGTTSGAYSTAALWKPIDVTSPLYSWTASGSGTNEYYLRTSANGNPGFVAQPDDVYINGSSATVGTPGSLAAGRWGYGDNDTLGYSTLYVRLSAGGDPDAQDPGHVKFYQTPRATEHVRFAVDSASINSAIGLDQSGVAIGDFIVEEGYGGTIGSATLGYLYIDPDRFEFNGRGVCYINVYTAAIPVQIYGTASASEGGRGLYLRGSAITVASIMSGQVGIATVAGEVSTLTTVRVLGDDTSLWLGNGVTLTNLHQYAGSVQANNGITTIIVYGGTLTTSENGAMTTVTQHGGEYVYKSTGNITTFNLYGGTLDCQKSGAARTISTLNKYRGSWTIMRNKEAVTVTTETVQDTYTESASESGGGGGFI
jgi:hypothetical protein